MAIGGITFFALLLSAAIYADALPITNNTVQSVESVPIYMGQCLSLSCDADKNLSSYHRVWRKNDRLLAASTVIIVPDNRFRVVNEHVLSLENITYEDQGNYECEIVANPSVYKRFSVSVIEVVCGEPDDIVNGELDPSPGTVDTFRYGDKVSYTCHDGYVLVGSQYRTCLQPGTGWDGQVPTCELKAIATVSNRINTLENKLIKLFNSDMDTFLKVESKFTDLEGRVKVLEEEAEVARNGRGPNEHMAREVHHLKTALSINALRAPWESFLNAEVARLGVQDGHVVSEFIWLVKDFDSKMAAYKNLNFDYIESKPFYTHIPGYRMVLHLYPNYDQTNYVGLFAILLPGRFDDVIAWPFTSKYILSIGTFNSEQSNVFDTIVPARATSCKFERPPPNNDVGCGFAAFFEHKILEDKGHLHKFDGGILFRISIYLDD